MKKFEVQSVDEKQVVEADYFLVDHTGTLAFEIKGGDRVCLIAPGQWRSVKEVNDKAASAKD